MAADLNISLILKLVDQVTAPARGAINAVRRIGEATDDVGRKGVAWSNEQLAANAARKQALQGEAFGVVATGAALYQALKPAIQFETSMAGVKKVLDFETPQGLADMQADILALTTSEGLPMTAKGIAEIIEAAGQAGVVDTALPDDEERAQLIAFARDAAQMGVAFDISAGQSGEAMAQWRKAMGLTQDEAIGLGDMINHLSNNMNATAPGMVDIIRRQGAVAQAAGLAENEIAALSAAFLSGGASPEIAATGMKNFLGALTDGEAMTKRQSAVMKELGFDAVDMSKRMQVDAKGAIIDVMEALAQLPKHKQSAALSQLFGEESKGAIAPLLTNVQLLHEAFDLVAEPTQYAGSMLEEYKTQAATTANALILTTNYVTALAVAAGSVLLPEINALLETVQPMIGIMTEWAAEHPELITLMFRVGAGLLAMKVASIALRWTLFSALTPLLYLTRSFSWILILLPKLAAGLLALLSPMKLIKGAIFMLRAAFLATGIGALLAGIALAGLWIYQNWAGLETFFVGFWDGFRAALGPAGPMLEGIIDYATQLLDWFKNLLGPMDATQEQWRNWGLSAGGAVGTVAADIKTYLAPVADAFGGAFDAVSGIVNTASTALQSTFGEGGNGRAALVWLGQITLATGLAALKSLGEIVSKLVGHLKDLAGWMADSAQSINFDFVTKIDGLAIAERATEIISALGSAIGSVVDLGVVSLKSLFGGLFDGFSNYIGPILTELEPIAGTLGTIIDDIAAMFRNFAEAAGLVSEDDLPIQGLRVLGNVLGHILGIVGTVAAGSLKAVVTFIGGLVSMIRSVTDGDLSAAFQPVIDFVTWLNNLTLDLLLPDFDGSSVAAMIQSWFDFDWGRDILPEWNWHDIIPDLPDFKSMFTDADDPLVARLENRASDGVVTWVRGAEMVEDYRQGLLTLADMQAELQMSASKKSNWLLPSLEVERAKEMLGVIEEMRAKSELTPVKDTKPAAPSPLITSPESLAQAAKAAEDLEAKLPAIDAAAQATLSATRTVLMQVATLLQGTDYTNEGARLGQSIANGLLSKVDAVREAAAKIGAAIRSAIPNSASVDVQLAGQNVRGKRDSGGPVMAGFPYLVGERAPEVFVPGVSGSILPTRLLRAAMAATAIGAPAAASTALMQPVEAVLSAQAVPMEAPAVPGEQRLSSERFAHTNATSSIIQTLRSVVETSSAMVAIANDASVGGNSHHTTFSSERNQSTVSTSIDEALQAVTQNAATVFNGGDRSSVIVDALQSVSNVISAPVRGGDKTEFEVSKQIFRNGDQLTTLVKPMQRMVAALPRPDVSDGLTVQKLSAASEIAAPAQTLKETLARSPEPQERLAPADATPQVRAAPAGGDTVTFNIYAAPGMSAQDVAQEVRRELKRREDARRGDLHDGVNH